MDVFQYSPINLDRPALRLVRLRSARAGPEIDCEFIEAFFDEDYVPDYEAISYTWGSVHTPSEIQLNGSKFAVTENLLSVLQDVRYREEDRILWIDAICIDQGSHSELGHQVQQMDQIYRRAQRVVIWLGPLTDPIALLMDALADLHWQIPGIDWPPNDPRWQISRDRLKDSSAERLTTLAQTFIDILERPWFRRVWVIQEVANARAALVHCGPKSVTARVFAACPNLLDVQAALALERNKHTRNAYAHCQAILDVMPGPSRKGSWWSQDRDLCTLLKKFSNTEATREHDRVFALLGLCPEANAAIPVNYTQSIRELVTRVLLHICSCDIYLRFINYGTMEKLFGDLGKLHNTVLSSLLKDSEPSVIHAFIVEHGSHLTLTQDFVMAALTRKQDSEYCFSAVLELYRGYDAERSEAARVLPEIVACHGSAALVEAFLQRIPDCDLGLRNEFGHTALTVASRQGDLAIAEVLLERGADFNHRSRDARSPLQWASEAGSEAIMRLLLNRGALLPENSDARGMLLLQAIRRGQEDMVKTLIDRGVNLGDLKMAQNAPLVEASRLGNEAIVRLLLDSGAWCNRQDGEGNTAIMMASIKGHESVVRLLLERGASCSIRNAADETPLLRAAELGHKAIVELLLDRGVDFETRHRFGATPLSIARYMQHWDIAQLLVERGASEEAAREAQSQHKDFQHRRERRSLFARDAECHED